MDSGFPINPMPNNWTEPESVTVERLRKRIVELEAQVANCIRQYDDVKDENKRLLDIQGLLISWMKRQKTDTSYPHKPTQQTYWEQIVSDYPYLAEVDDG